MDFFNIFKKKKETKDYKAFDIIESVKGDYKSFEKKILNHSIIMLITGKRGSGKTALGMKFLELFKEKDKKKIMAMGFDDANLPWKIKKINDIEDAKKNSIKISAL